MFLAVSDDCIVNTDQVKCISQFTDVVTFEFIDGTCVEIRGTNLGKLVKPLEIQYELGGERVP